MLVGETAKMRIRTLTLDDVPALAKILGDPEVMRYSVRGACDEAATRRFVEWSLDCYRLHGIGPWALVEKRSSELVGSCGIAPERIEGHDEINLGYRLARRFWGAGLATESVRGVLEYAFGEKRLPSVVAIIDPEHTASRRVAEKAGFRDYHDARFHQRPVRLYRISLDQWTVAQTGEDKPCPPTS